ncbi:MAG: cytochrome C oxidase subunit I [Ginsengibacter sp.]
MLPASPNQSLTRNTSHNLVLPFYIYAAISFLAGTVFLFFSSSAMMQYYFHPQTLAITHIMALGWGTMMIFGASHQLVPVLIERKIFSEQLGYIAFVLAGVGIPLLVYGFYYFHFGWQAKWGAILINVSILVYLVNMAVSMAKSKKENVHAVYVFTGTLWLFLTTLLGLLLVYNFTQNILSMDSLHYLPLHAHLGIAGWFLLLIMGVGSRLIPMFFISKYDNTKTLWWIYGLINIALIIFLVEFLSSYHPILNFLPVIMVLVAILLFGRFCFKCYKDRLRRKVDEPLQMSMLSTLLMAVPMVFLIVIILWNAFYAENSSLILTYGFCIFFGWITAVIFGMTFKTLPFILWNKKYQKKMGTGKTPNPKELFSTKVFKGMTGFYISGFVLFITGILFANIYIIQFAAFLLIVTAFLYNMNVFKMIFHKPENRE